MSTDKTLHHQILAQILITSLNQVKNNENLRHFHRQQQDEILRNTWMECFILRASHWSIDITSVINHCDDSNLKYAIDSMKALKADLIELSLLETLILFRKGFIHFSQIKVSSIRMHM